MLGGAYGMQPFQQGYDEASRKQANQYFAASPFGSGSMSGQVNPYRSMPDRGNSITQEQSRFGNWGNDTMGMSARANGYGQQLTKEQIDAMTGGGQMRDAVYIAGRDGPGIGIPGGLGQPGPGLTQEQIRQMQQQGMYIGNAQNAILRYPPGTVIPGVNGQPPPMQRPTPGNMPGQPQPYTGRSPQQIARDNAAKAAQAQQGGIAGNRAEIEKLRARMGQEGANDAKLRTRAQFLQRQNQNTRIAAGNERFGNRADELNQVQDRLQSFKNPNNDPKLAARQKNMQERVQFLSRMQNNTRQRFNKAQR
jgi:hypothetical protein